MKSFLKSTSGFVHTLFVFVVLLGIVVVSAFWFVRASRNNKNSPQRGQSLGVSTYADYSYRTPPLTIGPWETVYRPNVDFSDQLNSTEIASLLDWNDWYPMDFNVPENHRIIREQIDPEGNITRGFSFNVHNDIAPGYWPSTYKGKQLDYVFFAECNGKVDCYPDANDWYKYFEITTVGDVYPTGTAKAVTLESWQRRSLYNPETYYDLAAIKGIGGDCTTAFFTKDPKAAQVLSQAKYKAPLIWTLPSTGNSYVVNPPVCAVYFKHADNFSATPSRVDHAERFFVIGVNKSISSKELYAFNSYMKEGVSTRLSSYCKDHYQTDRFHCIAVNGVGSPRPYVLDNRTYYPADFEEYWMRKTSKTGRWGNAIDSGGFYKFRWWESYTATTWPTTGHDATNTNYYVESCGRWGTSPKACTKATSEGVPFTVYARTSFTPFGSPEKRNLNVLSQVTVAVYGKLYGHVLVDSDAVHPYTFYVPSSVPISDITVYFTNNGIDSNDFDRNLVVTKALYKGKEYLATSPKTYTWGSWLRSERRCSNINDGANNYTGTDELACAGVFRFSD